MNASKTNFQKTFELFAKILAKENVTVIYDDKAETGSFDIVNRTITMPTYDFMADDENTMMCSHEVGHALYTTRDLADHIRITKDVGAWLNVCEDVYIEKKIQSQFSGLREVFIKGYKTMLDNGFLGNEETITDLLNKVNTYFKARSTGEVGFINFSAEEQKLVNELDFIDLSKPNDVCEKIVEELAYKFRELEKQEKQQEKSEDDQNSENSDESENSNGNQNSENSDESENSNGNQNSENSDENSGNQNSENSNGNQNSENSNGNQNSENSDENSDENSGNQNSEGDEPTQDTILGSNLRSAKAEYNSKANNITIYASIDTKVYNRYQCFDAMKMLQEQDSGLNEKNIRKNDLFADITNSSASTAKTLFEQLKSAKNLKLQTKQKSGRLDQRKLFKHKTSAKLFKSKVISPKEANHALIIMFDMSGSMNGSLEIVMMNIVTMCNFAKKAKIPFTVFYYNSRPYIYGNFDTDRTFECAKLMDDKNYDPDKLMSLDHADNEYDKVCCWGGTPFSGALCTCAECAKEYKMQGIEKVNVVICTDGCPNMSEIYINPEDPSTTISIDTLVGKWKEQHSELGEEVLNSICNRNICFVINGKKYRYEDLLNRYCFKEGYEYLVFVEFSAITSYIREVLGCTIQMCDLDFNGDYFDYHDVDIAENLKERVPNNGENFYDTWSAMYDCTDKSITEYKKVKLSITERAKTWAKTVIRSIA